MKKKVAKAAPAAKVKHREAKVKVLVDNDKVKAIESRYRPGDVHKALPSASTRIIRVLSGGTLERTPVVGKPERFSWKSGEVKYMKPEKKAYLQTENVGKTDVVLYVVVLK